MSQMKRCPKCDAFFTSDRHQVGCVLPHLSDMTAKEIIALRSSLAIAQAEAAKGWEALNELISCGLAVPEPGDKRGMKALINARATLTSTAGRDLLARMEKLEKVAEAATKLRKWDGHEGGPYDARKYVEAQDELDKLLAALDALKGEGKDVETKGE